MTVGIEFHNVASIKAEAKLGVGGSIWVDLTFNFAPVYGRQAQPFEMAVYMISMEAARAYAAAVNGVRPNIVSEEKRREFTAQRRTFWSRDAAMGI